MANAYSETLANVGVHQQSVVQVQAACTKSKVQPAVGFWFVGPWEQVGEGWEGVCGWNGG